MLVGSLGSFALPNYKAYAQDSDSDDVIDEEDQCPNDPTAWTWVAPCPATGDEQYGTSTGDEQYGTSTGDEQVSTPEDVAPTENTATEAGGVSQAEVCDNSIDDDNDNGQIL